FSDPCPSSRIMSPDLFCFFFFFLLFFPLFFFFFFFFTFFPPPPPPRGMSKQKNSFTLSILTESPSCAPVRIGDLLQARVPVAVPAPSFSDNPSGPATPHYSQSSSHDTPPTQAREYVLTGTRPEHAPPPANPPSPAQ